MSHITNTQVRGMSEILTHRETFHVAKHQFLGMSEINFYINAPKCSMLRIIKDRKIIVKFSPSCVKMAPKINTDLALSRDGLV